MTGHLSAPIHSIWLKLRFVTWIANRKSLAIWDRVSPLRKAHWTDFLYTRLALRFEWRFEQGCKSEITRFRIASDLRFAALSWSWASSSHSPLMDVLMVSHGSYQGGVQHPVILHKDALHREGAAAVHSSILPWAEARAACWHVVELFLEAAFFQSHLLDPSVGLVSGRTEFSRIFFLSCRIFSQILSPDFSQLCGRKWPEESSKKIPGKIFQILYNKIPRHISAEGPGRHQTHVLHAAHPHLLVRLLRARAGHNLCISLIKVNGCDASGVLGSCVEWLGVQGVSWKCSDCAPTTPDPETKGKGIVITLCRPSAISLQIVKHKQRRPTFSCKNSPPEDQTFVLPLSHYPHRDQTHCLPNKCFLAITKAIPQAIMAGTRQQIPRLLIIIAWELPRHSPSTK